MEKKIALKALAAAALILGFTIPAHAVTTTTTTIGDLSTMPAFSVTPIKSTGSFSDIFNFSLSSASSFGAYATNIKVPYAFSIAGFTLTVDGNSTVSDAASFSGTLASGLHSVVVSGTANGPIGGMYNLTMVAAPVPEAQEWVMLMAGMGVVGFMLRKRRPVANIAA